MSDEGGEAPCFAGLLSGDDVDDHVLARLVRGMADAVVIADADGTIVFWNEAATRLFGSTASDAVGKPLEQFVPDERRAGFRDAYRRIVATGRLDDLDGVLCVPALRAGGKRIPVACTLSLVRPAAMATVSGVAAVIRDDTPRKR